MCEYHGMYEYSTCVRACLLPAPAPPPLAALVAAQLAAAAEPRAPPTDQGLDPRPAARATCAPHDGAARARARAPRVLCLAGLALAVAAALGRLLQLALALALLAALLLLSQGIEDGLHVRGDLGLRNVSRTYA